MAVTFAGSSPPPLQLSVAVVAWVALAVGVAALVAAS